MTTDAPPPAHPLGPPRLQAAPARPRLLVVDDHPVNIEVLWRTFQDDHQVFMATSGEQALRVCREQRPDLVLLDVVMPGMDGYEVCTQLKADPLTQDIPVIFVTAQDDADSEARGLDAGAVDFISKPVNPRVVRARVKTHVTLKAQSDLLRQFALIDGLTGVANRRHFDERLASEAARAQRSGTVLSLLLIDVDHFKRYNDRYGHQAGDDCLRRVAAGLSAQLKRPADVLARYGGEEFGCILPETDLPGALQFAAALERVVRGLQLPHECSDVADVVTVSLGVAVRCRETPADAQALLALADAQLYAAKAAGRGRACAARTSLSGGG